MKIGFFEHNPAGTYWYRIKRPRELLQRNGIETRLIRINQDVDDDIDVFQVYGAHPFSMERPIKWMKENNRKIIYDLDDAMHLIDESNPFYHDVKKSLGSVDEKLHYADEMTCSTPEMEKYLRTMTDKPITILPNTFTASEWTFPRPQREGLRIGFAGSPTHIGDLLLVLPAIRNLQKKYKFTFILFGFGIQKDYKDWFNHQRYISQGEGLKDLIEFDKILSDIDFEYVPFIDYNSYPATLTNISLDIGLCPLKDTPFNRCRSACKAMEYTLSGALALASKLPPYEGDNSSILVGGGNWEDALEALIKHPEVIKGLHEGFYAWIKANREDISVLPIIKKVYGLPM